MKKKKHLFLLLGLMLVAGLATAQESLQIETSAVCGMCKLRIEKDMAYERGVKSSSLDVETGILTLSYNPKKTDPETIKRRLTEIGYHADELARDPVAFSRLPECCRLGHSED